MDYETFMNLYGAAVESSIHDAMTNYKPVIMAMSMCKHYLNKQKIAKDISEITETEYNEVTKYLTK